MPDLKLGRLPGRNRVKLSITITQDLETALQAYASLYASTYGAEERVTDLIPAMLTAFLENDRAFARMRKASSRRQS